MARSASLLLPATWSIRARRSVLHALSVAATALTRAWSRSASNSRGRTEAAESRLRTEIALLSEELALKDERWARAPAHKRPHYGPMQRMRILELRALRG